MKMSIDTYLHIDAIATDDKFLPVHRKKTFTTPVGKTRDGK